MNDINTNPSSLTLADIQERRWALETPEAEVFLSAIAAEVKDKFKNCFLRTDIESQEAKEVRSYLLQRSTITQMVMADTTSSLTFEYLYLKKPVDSEIDEYFPRGKAARAIYDRLLALKANLPDIIRKEVTDKKLAKFSILNVGSGPSHEMIEILDENRDLARVVHVTCVEPDGEAIKIGQKRVNELGLTKSFTFMEVKLQNFKTHTFDMILVIGLLCPMSTKICVKILSNLVYFTKFGGVVIYSTVQKIMGEEDPLTDYIMRLSGWHMHYKNDGEPNQIALASGWSPVGRFFDKLGYNCMTVARLEWNLSTWAQKSLLPIYNLIKTFSKNVKS